MLLHKDSFAVAKAASDDASRYAITGMLVDSDGTTVATDGHVLVRFRPTDAPAQADYPSVDGFAGEDTERLNPFILPKADAIAAAKMIGKGGRRTLPVLNYLTLDVARTNANGSAYLASTDLETVKTAQPRKIDMKFPNVDQVIPDKDDAKVTIGFTLDVLLKALDTMKALGVKTFALGVKDAMSPVRLDAKTDNGEVVSVVMPCRM